MAFVISILDDDSSFKFPKLLMVYLKDKVMDVDLEPL